MLKMSKRRCLQLVAALWLTLAGLIPPLPATAASARNSPVAPDRSSVRLDDGRGLSYLRWPAPGRPVMLLLHGKNGYASSFADLAAHLGNRYDIYAIDMRGRGFSDWAKDSDYTAESTVADVAQFVRLMGWKRIALYGHSYGSAIALTYAAGNPDTVTFVILEDGGPIDRPDGSPPRVLNPGQNEVAGSNSAPAPPRLAFQDWRSVQEWQARNCRFQCTAMLLESQFVRAPGGVIERNDQAGIAASARGDAFLHQWSAVRSLKSPTLLLRAERGLVPLEVAQAMTRENDSIRFVSIEGGLHALRASSPRQTFAAMDRFLAAQAKTGAGSPR